MIQKVRTGLEHFIDAPPAWITDQRLGLLSNPASVSRDFAHARELIHQRFQGQLKALYSPQHGFFAEKQDNMIESDHLIDPILQIPVFSLYGETRIPTQEMFDLIDVLIIDLQDAGTRVYTFIYTMSYCLEAAKAYGKKVLVLDRPNPVNGMMVEGNCLNPEYASFVGRYPIPMRHGLTIGELARLFNQHFQINCELEVVPMNGWRRQMYFQDTGLPWIPPSPNLPTPTSAMVYPGQVLWEGTNISEGRGTTQPFEIFGAPFIDTEKMRSYLGGNKGLPGIILRPVIFEPTSNKWARHASSLRVEPTNCPCRGFQIHITDPYLYKPYLTTLRFLQAVISLHKDHFEWKQPPYEYEFDKLPTDLIIGDAHIRRQIENLEDIDEIAASWQDQLNEFIEISNEFRLYERNSRFP